MKRSIVLCALTLLFVSGAMAQQLKTNAFQSASSNIHHRQVGESRPASAPVSNFPSDPLPSYITVPGTSDMGIRSQWHLASSGASYHNFQIDPSNSQNIHVAFMGAINTSEDDTTTTNYFPNRRVYYTFSSDGGKSWTNARPIANVRTGYPCLRLLERGGQYVAVIAAHPETPNGDVNTVLFIEQGDAGTGTFKQVVADRKPYNAPEDTLRDIIWPQIAISNDGTKIYTVASVFASAGVSIDKIQFGVFTLDGTKMDATFSGWKEGPGATSNSSLAYSGQYALQVSPAGKLGVVWINQEYDPIDHGMYLSESTDDGTTWSAPNQVYIPVTVTFVETNPQIHPESFDFFYKGEEVEIILSGSPHVYQDGGSAYTYYPSVGTLLYLPAGGGAFRTLVCPIVGEQDLPDSELPSDFLSNWAANILIGGANLDNAVIARTENPLTWSVFFNAWEGFAQDVEPFEVPNSSGVTTYDQVACMSIWKITTNDGGTTWTDAEMVLGNSFDDEQSAWLDYNYPSVSSFNPNNGGVVPVFFTVDSLGGYLIPGYFGFSSAEFKALGSVTNSVPGEARNGINTYVVYPNPVTVGEKFTVPMMLDNLTDVHVSIVDVLGREVAVVHSGSLAAGEHSLTYTTKNLSAGTYQLLVKTTSGQAVTTITVVR